MDLALQIGQKIRTYRTDKHLTIKELAEKADITSSMLSQIERGQATPSLNTIRLLAVALDEPIYRFFLETENVQSDIVRKKDRRRIVDKGVNYEMLSPDNNGNLEMMLLTLAPGEESCKTPLAHKGEEISLIEKGTLELTLGTQVFLLHEGDSVHIKSEIKHRWYNPTDQTSILLFAVTPPSF